MVANQIVDQETTSRQSRHRSFFVGMHQPTVAFDICSENRDQAPLQFGCFHLFNHWSRIGQQAGRGISAPARKHYFFVRDSPLLPWASVE
jgi:hypothetical protein